ncbi:hypothetical protein PFZ55_48530 [Streptomyces sp. MS2A]|nr:hypothetical protein [Streptomyces sp. MS2A]
MVAALALVVANVGGFAVPANAAEPFDDAYLYGTSAGANANVYRIDPASGAATIVLAAPANPGLNALALSADGNAMLAVSSADIFMYDAPSETWTQTPRVAGDAPAFTMGGVNSVTGYFYYGGLVSGDLTTARYAAYDLATNTPVPNALTVVLPGNTGNNGDVVFDQQGNMYIVASDPATGEGSQVWRVDAGDVSTSTGGVVTATRLGDKILDTQLAVGVAFGLDGYAYFVRNAAAGGSELLRTDPVTFGIEGAPVPVTPSAVRLNDLASRAFQPTALVNVDLPEGRYAARDTDQFHITMQGPGSEDPLLEAETTGDEIGLQDQEQGEYIGRIATFPGDTFRIGQSAAGTTNLGNYTTTWQCINIGNREVVASGSGNSGSFYVPTAPVIDVDCTFTNIPISPSLTLEKSADKTELVAGETITYSFLVTNTGNVALDVVVNEVSFTGSGDLSDAVCDPSNLAPEQSVTCTATYTVTQEDVDRGSVDNSATATGTPPNGGDPVTSDPSDVSIPGASDPGITIEKSAQADDGSVVGDLSLGDTITYTFVVTNTGNVTLNDIVINETEFTGSGEMSDIVCEATTLAPNQSTTCTATYEVTQADVDAGQIDNEATATGTPPRGDPVTSPPDDVTVPQEQNPGISLVKSADPEAYAVGDTITYTFAVENTGNVTLNDIVIDEGDFSGSGELSDVTCEATSLVPGASTTCTATYEATQADVDAGSISNSATATGTPPSGGDPITSDPSEAEVTSDPQPGIAMVKSASTDTLVAGETITYTFAVENTGNVTLNDIVIDEGEFTGSGELSPVTCEPTTLAPGETVDCTATYVVTQADVDAGSITNAATASGTSPTGDPVGSPPSAVEITADPQPGIALVKSADKTELVAGETITYSFTVENTGNVTLSDVVVNETEFSGTGEMSEILCEPNTVAPGNTITCTATYEVTQEDVDRGSIENTATATGTPPGGAEPITSEPSEAQVPGAPAPGISVVKSADRAELVVGETITYSFVVTNTGNVTLTDVAVSEGEFTGTGELSEVVCDPTTLAPGASVTCTATYVVTQADVDRGSIENTASATGTPPNGTPVVSEPSAVRLPQDPQPAIAIVKTADTEQVSEVGQVVTYSFTVTNTGNTTLMDVRVDDSAFSGAGELSEISCPADAARLVPGQTVVCTATYTVLAADLTGDGLSNVAVAEGTPPGGEAPIVSPPSEVVIDTAVPPRPTPAPTAPAPKPPVPGLPVTGGELSTGIVLLALLLLVGGAGFAGVARRRRTTEG